MARDLGSKYVCFKCAAKFYDLKKPVPTCPKCGSDQRDAPVIKAPGSGRSRAAAVVKEPEEAELPAADAEAADEEEDDEKEPAADDE